MPGFGAEPQALCRSTKKRALRVPTGHKKRGSLKHLAFLHNTQSARSPRRGRAALIKKHDLYWKDPRLPPQCPRAPAVSSLNPRFSLPFGRSQRSTAHPAAAPRAPAASCKDPRFSQSLATLNGPSRRSAPALPQLPASTRVSRSLSVARNAHGLCCGTGFWGTGGKRVPCGHLGRRPKAIRRWGAKRAVGAASALRDD